MVALDADLDERVNKLAEMMNTSKTKTIEYLVSNSVDLFSQFWSAMQTPNMINTLQTLSNALGDAQTTEDIKNLDVALQDPKNKATIEQITEALQKHK